VKVFDLRTNRQLPPMSMSLSSPSLIRFVPAPAGCEGFGESAVLLAAAGGVLQLCPSSGDQAASQLLYAPLTDRKEIITAVAVASSGQLLCVGTSLGNVAQYGLCLPGGVNQKINQVRL
jgi:hypothetical protein